MRGQIGDREGTGRRKRGKREGREMEGGRDIQLEIENQQAILKGSLFHYCK